MGAQTPIDVYDAASWSVSGRSAVVDVPDFNRGKWKEKRELTFPGIETLAKRFERGGQR